MSIVLYLSSSSSSQNCRSNTLQEVGRRALGDKLQFEHQSGQAKGMVQQQQENLHRGSWSSYESFASANAQV